MDKLKEALFERTLRELENLKVICKDDFAYRLSALYSFIIESGLDEEFQQYKKEREDSEE